MEYLDYKPLRWALAGLALALAFALWALASALRPGSLPAAARAAAPTSASIATGTPLLPANIEGAVEQDVFSPDRSPPDEPFRMPGENVARATTPTTKPTVLGTAVGPGAFSFATAQLGGSGPRIVHVGDKVGPFTVASIERGLVVFTAPGGDRIDIAALTASNANQVPTNGSQEADITSLLAPFNGRAGRGAFFNGGGAGRGRGRRGASPDSTTLHD